MYQPIDYYKILQVDEAAQPDVVRAAYRVLARAYHPDVQGGSVERMVALNNAWAVISDDKKRAAYDQTRNGASREPADRPTGHEPAHVGSPPAESRRPRGRTPDVPATPSTILDFGRYQGWTLQQVARQDPDFLEWLARTPTGRPYRAEIESLLAADRVAAMPTTKPSPARRSSSWKARR